MVDPARTGPLAEYNDRRTTLDLLEAVKKPCQEQRPWIKLGLYCQKDNDNHATSLTEYLKEDLSGTGNMAGFGLALKGSQVQ